MDEAAIAISESYHDQVIIAHAVLGAIAVFVTAPAAILIARYFRHSRWYPAHAVLNATTAALIIIVFSLGMAAVNPPPEGGHGSQFTGKHADTHHRMGLVTFLLVMLQSLGGLAGHYLKPGHLVRWAHILIGVGVMGLLWAQFYSGFHEWDTSSESATTVPCGVIIVFWILLALELLTYAAGLYIGRKPTLPGRTLTNDTDLSQEKEAIA